MDDRLNEWRAKIATVRGFEGEKLKDCAEEFLASEHAARAVELGWSELELFGIFKGDLGVAGRRRDTLGLIPAMAHGNQHTYTIAAMEAERVVLRSNGGATLTSARKLPAEELAVPFWEHPALRGQTR